MHRHAPDRLAAGLGLIALAPVLAMLALAILLETGRPILFRQKRIGRGGAPFPLCKFRSMRTEMPGTKITAGSDARVTPVGRFLRAYKLDELPQLWNVFRGEMNLVGPRPEIPAYVDMNDARWRSVLEVRPGITDLATLLYRNEEELLASVPDPEEFYRASVLPAKLRLNLQYLENSNFFTDLKIIAITIFYSLFPSRFDTGVIRRAVGLREI